MVDKRRKESQKAYNATRVAQIEHTAKAIPPIDRTDVSRPSFSGRPHYLLSEGKVSHRQEQLLNLGNSKSHPSPFREQDQQETWTNFTTSNAGVTQAGSCGDSDRDRDTVTPLTPGREHGTYVDNPAAPGPSGPFDVGTTPALEREAMEGDRRHVLLHSPPAMTLSALLPETELEMNRGAAAPGPTGPIDTMTPEEEPGGTDGAAVSASIGLLDASREQTASVTPMSRGIAGIQAKEQTQAQEGGTVRTSKSGQHQRWWSWRHDSWEIYQTLVLGCSMAVPTAKEQSCILCLGRTFTVAPDLVRAQMNPEVWTRVNVLVHLEQCHGLSYVQLLSMLFVALPCSPHVPLDRSVPLPWELNCWVCRKRFEGGFAFCEHYERCLQDELSNFTFDAMPFPTDKEAMMRFYWLRHLGSCTGYSSDVVRSYELALNTCSVPSSWSERKFINILKYRVDLTFPGL